MPEDLSSGVQSGSEAGQGAGETGEGDGVQSGTDSNSGTGQDQSARQGQERSPERDQELETVRNRMRAADQRASKLEAELRQLKDKDLPEADKIKRDVEDLTQQNKQLVEDLRKARIDNAFLKDNTHEWHDPSSALRMADLSTIVIDEDGKVTGLKEVLNRLAKDNPWMVRPKSPSEGDGKGADGQQGNGSAGATAPPMNSGTGTGKPPTAGLQRRFPMLGTRPVRPR